MARRCADAALDTLTGRKGLAPRAAPYWRAVRLGLRIGYRRKPGEGCGVWLMRLALPGNNIVQKVLGGADDHPARANGVSILSYAQAADVAQAAVTALTARGKARAAKAAGAPAPKATDPTVRDALRAYANAKDEAGQSDRAGEAETVLRRADALAAKRCADLTADDLRHWLSSLTKADGSKLSQGRVDKLANCLRAALGATGAVADRVMAEGLGAAAVGAARGLREEAGTRNVILSREQLAAVLRGADAVGEDFGILAAVLSVTALRPSQIIGCALADLDARDGVLTVAHSNKGKPGVKKSGAIHAPLPRTLIERMQARAKALKLRAVDRLFTRAEMVQADGVVGAWLETGERAPWEKKGWHRAFLRAAEIAAEAGHPLPADASLYALRHTRICTWIDMNLPIREVAARADTGVSMIEKTYARNIAKRDSAQDRVRAALEAEFAGG